jgi:CRISPR system Cascade subunit CasC
MGKTMFVELHLLQNFAPSNLNRDDTGSPKECEFGSYRRARISSQCFKRAIRTVFPSLLGQSVHAIRTKLVVSQKIVPALVDCGRDPEQARAAVESALSAVKLKLDEDGRTQYLLFLSISEIAALADVCDRHFEALTEAAGRGGGVKRSKREALADIPIEVREEVQAILDGGRAADLALFGRMLTDLPEKNIHAAAQVAHAISTNRVSHDFDYFTAVDDLNPKEEPGVGMIGTVEFNSACFYRYLNLDLAQLTANLKGDSDLARRTLQAFIRATVEAVPSGKQNSMAANNPPSFVMAVVRQTGLWSLANAFLDPVRPDGYGDLVRNSVVRLDRHWGELKRMYGDKGIAIACFTSLDSAELTNLGAPLDNIDALLKLVMSEAR